MFFNSSRKSAHGIPKGPIIRPFQNPIDEKKGVLDLPLEPDLLGDKFMQPAFLGDFGALEGTANDAQKPKEQQPQQQMQAGKGISLPKFSIEEIRGSADMDSKDPDLALKRWKIKEASEL
ncbi:unnamed protein product [Rodentolepis nana]|uniref:Uncharacterized protein n=1 Tax=Rodentolepis nana TaxID=102285 RepID=A0A0R3TFR9_RODNA|nr:unnamed protein product [Rodentolepis nana]